MPDIYAKYQHDINKIFIKVTIALLNSLLYYKKLTILIE